MTEISLTILPETAADAPAIDRLHERTFGPGCFAKTAYRLRRKYNTSASFPLPRDRHPADRFGLAIAGAHWRGQGLVARTTYGRAHVSRARGRTGVDRPRARGGPRQGTPAGDPGRRRALLWKMRLQAHSAWSCRDARPGRSRTAPRRRACRRRL